MRGGPATQSLAARLLLFAFGSTLTGALVISWVAIDSTRVSLEALVDRTHPAALARAASRVHEWLESGETAARKVVSIGPRSREPELRALAEASAELRAVAWVDPQGVAQRASGPLPPQLLGAPLRDMARRKLETLVPVSIENGESTLGLWLPGDPDGLVAVLERAQLAAALSELFPDEASVFSLVNGAGAPFLSFSGGRSDTPRVVDLARLHALPGELSEYSVADRALLGAALPLGIQDLYLVLQTPLAAAHAPMHALVQRVLGVAALAILVVSLLAYGLSARALRPIEALSVAARRFAAGETDVDLPEVRSRDEVGMLTQTLGEMLDQIRTHREQLEAANRNLVERNSELESANEVLNQLSITDGLTQLHNHRFFQDFLTREIKRVTRSGEVLSMLLLDIDDFKKLNDRHGHAAGDEVLRRIASLLDTNVRESDLLARYGGEEFVVLACGSDLPGAAVLAEKLRTAIAENSFIVDDSLRPVCMTVSIGVAQYAGNRKRFFADADDALYRAKAAGKNCVVVAD